MNYAHPSTGWEVGNGPSPAVRSPSLPVPVSPRCLTPLRGFVPILVGLGADPPLEGVPAVLEASQPPQIVFVKMRFDLYQREPVENVSPLGWWGLRWQQDCCWYSLAQALVVTNVCNVLHVFYYLCVLQAGVQSHTRTCVFEGISSSDCGCPTVFNGNVLLGDFQPRCRDCTEAQQSVQKSHIPFCTLPKPRLL